MEQAGLTPRDLEPMIGRLNRVYEVLARKRPLTMAMVWRLHTQLGIPAESLIRPTRRVSQCAMWDTLAFLPVRTSCRIQPRAQERVDQSLAPLREVVEPVYEVTNRPWKVGTLCH
jgi:hypothetical protein